MQGAVTRNAGQGLEAGLGARRPPPNRSGASQLGRREEFFRCLLEALQMTQFDAGPLKGPYAEQIHELLGETPAERSAG